jgi:hypothetical protein
VHSKLAANIGLGLLIVLGASTVANGQIDCDGAFFRASLSNTARADLIVMATIASKRCYEDTSGAIWTEFRIEIGEVLKGEAGDSVRVITSGGTISRTDGKWEFQGFAGSDFPKCNLEDQVLLYLIAGDSPGFYRDFGYFKFLGGKVIDADFGLPVREGMLEGDARRLVADLVACCDYRAMVRKADVVLMGTVESIREDRLSTDESGPTALGPPARAATIVVERVLKGTVPDERVIVLFARVDGYANMVNTGAKMILLLRKGIEGWVPVVPVAGLFLVSRDGALAMQPGLSISVEELSSAPGKGE